MIVIIIRRILYFIFLVTMTPGMIILYLIGYISHIGEGVLEWLDTGNFILDDAKLHEDWKDIMFDGFKSLFKPLKPNE